MIYLWATLLVVVLLVGWLLTLFNLPGTWLMVVAAAVFAWYTRDGAQLSMSWPTVAVLVVLALLGELAEFVAGAWGARSRGGSKRAAVLAIVGSIAGALVGAVAGVPVPIVGSLIGVVLFAALGALGGAMLGEAWKGRALHESWQVGQGAFWGRLLGTVAKTAIATIMLITATAATFIDDIPLI